MKTPYLCVRVRIQDEELVAGHLIYDHEIFLAIDFRAHGGAATPSARRTDSRSTRAAAFQRIDALRVNLRWTRNGPAPLPGAGPSALETACYDLPVAVAAL